MKHSGRNEQEKTALLNKLKDLTWAFTKDELEAVINNEFFNDENSLNTDLVDAAVSRLLLLEGIDLNEATLQQARENMISGVFKRILKPKK